MTRKNSTLKGHHSALALAVLLAAFLRLPPAVADGNAGNQGTVRFSNGEMLQGAITIAGGQELPLPRDRTAQVIPFPTIAEIRLKPEQEEMARRWTFVEAGRTEKEEVGKPYPVRHLVAEITMRDGTTATGYVYTAMLYVETAGETRKVLLPAKQRGPEGTSLADLVYPASVKLASVAPAAIPALPAATSVEFRLPGGGQGGASAQVVALAADDLARLPASLRPDRGTFTLPAAVRKRFFLAIQTPAGIRVGWKGEPDAKLAAAMDGARREVRDFFDRRECLGTVRDDETTVYTLMLLSREEHTTLDAKRSQPWRLEVWRWRYDEPGGRLMLAGRGYFFRGILERNGKPPPMMVDTALWPVGMETAAAGKEEDAR
jgi:hypothetical protein